MCSYLFLCIFNAYYYYTGLLYVGLFPDALSSIYICIYMYIYCAAL